MRRDPVLMQDFNPLVRSLEAALQQLEADHGKRQRGIATDGVTGRREQLPDVLQVAAVKEELRQHIDPLRLRARRVEGGAGVGDRAV